jgi:hypothetical protein
LKIGKEIMDSIVGATTTGDADEHDYRHRRQFENGFVQRGAAASGC